MGMGDFGQLPPEKPISLELWVVEPDGYGGLIHFSFELCQALADEGHRVSLVTSKSYELDQVPHRFTVRKLMKLWNPTLSNKVASGRFAHAGKIVRRGRRGIRLT